MALILLTLSACGGRSTGVCRPDPCLEIEGASCIELTDGQATCQCRPGTVRRDDRCIEVSSCASNPCTEANRTSCRMENNNVVCDCDPGFKLGVNGCVSDSPVCSPNPCTEANRTLCVATDPGHRCDCDSGYQLTEAGCVATANACEQNPCKEANRTQCVISGNSYSCNCDTGYHLDAGQCVADTPCNPNPCTAPNQTKCTVSGDQQTHTCSCLDGFVPDPNNNGCIFDDPCSPNPCTATNKGRCLPSGGSFVCQCDVGYEPSGDSCQLVSTCGSLYNSALTKTNQSLVNSLHSLTSNNFDGVNWDTSKGIVFWTLDYNNGLVRGVYTGSMVPMKLNVLPNFNNEMNIEHSWPQSEGATGGAKSDLHHLFPTIPTVNSSRGSLPFGNVVNATKCYTSEGSFDFCDLLEGTYSLRGTTSKGTLSWEPPDDHKGDVARSMFYFSVRWEDAIDSEQEETFRQWHQLDPVSQKERDRNDAIKKEQNNRNPFIDCPHLVFKIDDF